MTTRALRVARGASLTLAAVLGVVCLLSVVAGVTLGIRPLVVQSGSMSPAIGTGDLAWAHQVPADDLVVGDVVMVRTEDGDRVTHRIIAIDRTTATTKLTLQGDANPVPDAQVYPVDDAYRVFADVPYGGRVVAFLSGPVGLFLMGMYAMGMLLLVLRRRKDDDVPPPPPGDGSGDLGESDPEQRSGHRRAGAAATAAATVLVLGVAAPSWAAWSDSASVTTADISTAGLTTPSLSCVRNSDSQVTVSWTAASSPGLHGYSASIVENSQTQPVSSSGATRSVVLSRSTLSSFSGQTFTLRVIGNLPGTSWTTANADQKVTIAAGGSNIDCGTTSTPIGFPPVTCSVVGSNGDWKVKLDWTYSPNPSTGFVVRATGGIPGAPATLGPAVRTWTSSGFASKAGQVWVVAVEGATEVEATRVNYDFGNGNGIGNKICPSS